MSYGNGLKEVVGYLLTVTVVLVLVCIFFFLSYLFSAEKLESKELIMPTIKLEINNNKVDTIYVYRVK